jgi:hypothetical protein
MGTSRSAAEFTLKLKRIPAALQGPQQLKVVKVGRDVTIRALDSELRRIAPSGRLRNAGPVSVRSQQVNVGGQNQAQFVISAQGNWQLIENNTKAHFIVAKLLGKTRRSRASGAANSVSFRQGSGGDAASGWFGAQLAREYQSRVRSGANKGDTVTKTRKGAKALTVGGVLRAYAKHPGTKGQHPWRKGRERAEKLAPKAMSAATVAEITKMLK